VNQHGLTLAVLFLAASVAAPAVAQTGQIRVFSRGVFNLAEAYPCAVGSYPAASGIEPAQRYCGASVTPLTDGAAPGILSLARGKDLALDINCFAVTPADEVGPCFVQSYQLAKTVPGSYKCPDVYGIPSGRTYHQLGSGVRTWWSLNFTQPGTQFVLDVISVCRARGADGSLIPALHRDTYTWRVVADVETLRLAIELMHSGAISTLEVPCILGEDMYDAMLQAQARLRDAIALPNSAADRLSQVAGAIFDMEALIVANCLFTEVLNPLAAFPGPDQFGAPNFQPPGNLAQTVFLSDQGSSVAGLIDTTEHPCCCKLLVDLEWIAFRNGLVGAQIPSLPTF
jgi:hypothetical protein